MLSLVRLQRTAPLLEWAETIARAFVGTGIAPIGSVPRGILPVTQMMTQKEKDSTVDESQLPLVTICMCGDVMTGRGIDQLLPHPSDPVLYEPFVGDARDYLERAEQASGPIAKPIKFSYVWGDVLDEWARSKPDLRIVNLETSITKSNENWPDKEIHYRMNPANIDCLTTANIDCCSLANNHVLDWGYSGLAETLQTLRRAGIHYAGAGANFSEAAAPAVLELPGKKGRVLVFSFASQTSGIPGHWAATKDRAGVNLLDDMSEGDIDRIQQAVATAKRHGDIAVASIHWGPNWGYEIPRRQREFAHALIDRAGIDVIHGHSSHHVKPLEVYRGRLIIYGCGDFLDDYEGISGYEYFRSDLGLMYFASVKPSTGELVHLEMTATQIRHMRIQRAEKADVLWLQDRLNHESRQFEIEVALIDGNTFALATR